MIARRFFWGGVRYAISLSRFTTGMILLKTSSLGCESVHPVTCEKLVDSARRRTRVNMSFSIYLHSPQNVNLVIFLWHMEQVINARQDCGIHVHQGEPYLFNMCFCGHYAFPSGMHTAICRFVCRTVHIVHED